MYSELPLTMLLCVHIGLQHLQAATAHAYHDVTVRHGVHRKSRGERAISNVGGSK